MSGWKDDFEDFEGRVWLDCAHQGPLPKVATEATKSALLLKQRPYKIAFEDFFQTPLRLKDSLARLIGAHPEEIVLGNSATYGIQVLVHGYPWKSGDEILVVEGDFPASVVPWRVLERKGVRVRFIQPAGSFLTPDDVRGHLTKDTRLLCATWVSSYTGWVCDLEAIGHVTRNAGVVMVANVSQGLGHTTLDVGNLPIDAITCCGFKWLLGPYGTGFAWFRPELLDRLDQYQAYWLWMQYPEMRPPDLTYDIRRPLGGVAFDIFGTANFLNYMPWQASVSYLLEQGPGLIASHDHRLVQLLVDGLQSTDMALISPPTAAHRSALVVFSHPDEGKNEELRNSLLGNGFHVSIRGGRIRVSPHLYNTDDDIEGFLDALRRN